MRIDGSLVLWKRTNLETGEKLISHIKADAGIDVGTEYHPVGERRRLDIDGEEVALRITLVPCVSGPKLAIGILDPGHVKRNLPSCGSTESQTDHFQHWLSDLNGMILVTRPTASGKNNDTLRAPLRAC